MKRVRHNKVLGLAIGERSIFVAEVAGGDRPEVRLLSEFVYPPALSLAQPAELGLAFDQFLKARGFTTRHAIAGVPAKWLAVKSKDVPPTDDVTLAELLRLQAETDFSTELKDLVYDFSAAVDARKARSVLLMALPRKHIVTLSALCDAGRIHLLAVTPSALVLSDVTAQGADRGRLVLATSPTGAELTAHRDSATSAVRHLRAPQPEPAFYSAVRRAITTMSNGSGAGQDDLILWDSAGIDRDALGKNLGMTVWAGDMASLGVDAAPAASNGEARKYGPAVALALAGVGGARLSVDFLQSRLAPPKKSWLPRWSVLAALALLVVILVSYLAYAQLQNRQADLETKKIQLNAMQDQLDAAKAFVEQVSFVQNWNGGDVRYIACLRNLTEAMPRGGGTYATNLMLRETPRQSNEASAAHATERATLTGKLDGKTETQQQAQSFRQELLNRKQFRDVSLDSTAENPRTHDVSFTITFIYAPDAK